MSISELAGSPEIILSRDGNTVRRQFKCLWSEWTTVVDAIASGGSDSIPKVQPWLANCYAHQITVRPLSNELAPSGTISDTATNGASYDHCLVEADYAIDYFGCAWPSGITKPSVRAGTILRLKTRFSGQFLTLPARAMAWQGASPGDPMPPTPPDMNARILIPITEYKIEWDYVTDPNANTIRGYVGGVNDATFLGVPAECLLLEGVEVEDSFKLSRTNPFCFKLTATFKERRVVSGGNTYGWNYDYMDKPTGSGWTRVIMADGTDRYRKLTFTNMFA